jgi:TolB-like protein
VLVLPFVAPAGNKDEWIGKAVQQDLLTDLTQGTVTRVLAPAGTPGAVDPQTAVQIAHDLGASIVVFGQAQVAGNEVRLTGEVLEVATAKPLGGLKATGPSDQLFHLEDALAGQVFLSLPRTLLTSQTVQGLQQAAANQQQPATGTPPASPETTQSTTPTSVYVNPPVDTGEAYAPQTYYSYPNYSYNYYQTPNYDYYYPAYTYAYPSWGVWPFWSSGIFFGGVDFEFHHHHDFDHRGFDNRFHGGHEHFDRGRGFGSTGRGFANGGAVSGARGGSTFAPARSGFGSTGFSRSGIQSRPMSRGFSGSARGGGFHSASAGGSRGGFSGGSRGGGGGGFHGGGAHGGGGHR